LIAMRRKRSRVLNHDILYPFASKAFRRCANMMRDGLDAHAMNACITIIDQCNAW